MRCQVTQLVSDLTVGWKMAAAYLVVELVHVGLVGWYASRSVRYVTLREASMMDCGLCVSSVVTVGDCSWRRNHRCDSESESRMSELLHSWEVPSRPRVSRLPASSAAMRSAI